MTEIREQIAQLIRDYTNQQIAIVVNATIPKNPLTSEGQADQILSLPEIAVLDEKQELPANIYNDNQYGIAQQDMLAAGWKKCLPNKG